MVAEGGEGENPLLRGGGGWGGGGGGVRGGYPGFVSLQVPTSEAAVSADTHAFARLPPGGLRKIERFGWFLWGKGPRVGGPQAPGAWIPPLSLCSRVFNFLRRKPMGPGLKTLGCYHNPQSAHLEGGALQFHERRVPVFAPAFQPQAPGDLANKPLSPASRQPSRVKNSKNAPVLIGSCKAWLVAPIDFLRTVHAA